jgi:hypothetical protein
MWPWRNAESKAGPVTEPKDLAKALSDAIKVVKEGKPALVDVVVQTR